jgi:anaerobic selenocysteine-containing dehydrogenase
LERSDLFTVVSELFITDTAKYADLLLPATMQAEQYDLMLSWGHFYMMLNQPAIPPPGECLPNIDLFRKLAKAMGFEDEYWSLSYDDMLSRCYDWNAPQMEGITLDLLKQRGFMRLNVGAPDKRAPHASGGFKTASGKCEFKSSLAADGNFVVSIWRSGYEAMQSGTPVDPVPDYIPSLERSQENGALAQRYPLNLVTPKPHGFLNSQYGNESTQQRRQGEQSIVLHPKDAAARKIRHGDYVRVFNDRGSFEARAEVSEDIMVGLLMTNVGHWPSLNRTGTGVNSTTPPRHANLGQSGAYFDNLVEVRPV